MGAMRRIASFADITPAAWANGAGETTELVSLVESAALTPDRARWRLSIARLERPGPFSSLPGVDRTFLPTAEVVLEISSTPHRAGPDSPLRFTGDSEVVLTELSEPCFAVNLMVETGGSLQGLTMIPEPSGPARFVLTLDSDEQWGRFDLLELDTGDELPDRLGVVGFD